MQMTFRLRLHGAAAACTVLLAACGGSGAYYMVRDPGSAKPYYTTDISTSGSALKFKDERTGNAITLQSSEVKEISKEEFTKGMTAPVPTPAAAIAAPAPAAAIAAPVPALTVGAQSPAAIQLPASAGASAPAAPQAKPQ
jgi:hypothetical protein